jgi:ATP-dependent protease ClpP protease subunit
MTDSANPRPSPSNKEVYGIFASVIDQNAVARVANAAAIASSNGVPHVHMAFQTMGGTVPDGVALYNLFKAFPVPITLYNIGSISSAGVIAYLGAANRVASSLSTFMIHRTTGPSLPMTSDRLEAALHSVELDDQRTEKIFEGLKFSEQHRKVHASADLWFSAAEAKEIGLATTIADFAPPKGSQLFFLGLAT